MRGRGRMAMHGMDMAWTGRVSAWFSEFSGRKFGIWLRSFGIMAVCARARMGPGIAPLAAAYFAASLRREEELPALLAGCALGAFVTGFDGAALIAPAACALALIFHLALEYLSGKGVRLFSDEGSQSALIAGLATLLPGLAAAGFDPVVWLLTLLAAVCAALLAAALNAQSAWWRDRIRLCAGGCAAILCAAGLGFDPSPVAVFLALIAAAMDLGTLAGCVFGVLCVLAGGDAGTFAAICIVGAAADFAPGGRLAGIWRMLIAAAAYAVYTLWMDIPPDGWIAAAMAAHACVPPVIIGKLMQAWTQPQRRSERLVQALRRRDEARLRSLSDAFGTLSQACGAGDPAFGEQQLITRMRAALCAGCGKYGECWPGANSGAVKLFCQLMTSAIECGGSPFRNGEAPPDIMRLCRRGMTVPSRLGNLLADFAAQRHRRIRLMEARRLLATQFDQASVLLNAMAAEQTSPFMVRDGAAAQVRAALANAGLPVRDVMALKLEAMEITVEITGGWSRERILLAERAISASLGRNFTLSGRAGMAAIFAPCGALRATALSSALPADPDHPCGDSCMIRELSGGRLFVAISDGMGSGEAAAEESCRVITLMHSLVSAGMPRELAASTVNGVLLSRGGEELFATADMLLIDLNSGSAEFTKLAACSSYIVRGGRSIVIDGGRLPLGILDEVRPGISSARLRRGDVVFMMSDGVSDALGEDLLEEVLCAIVTRSPDRMAEALIDTAAMHAGGRRDDMTAVCVMIA